MADKIICDLVRPHSAGNEVAAEEATKEVPPAEPTLLEKTLMLKLSDASTSLQTRQHFCLQLIQTCSASS